MRTIIFLLISFFCLSASGQKVVKEYYDILGTRILGEYQIDNATGLKNGSYKSYYPTGIVNETGFYKMNNKTGTWKTLDEYGKLWSIKNYTDGFLNGLFKEGNQVQGGGNFSRECIFKMGFSVQETHYYNDGQVKSKLFGDGDCKFWRPDGTLQSEWTNVEGKEVKGSFKYYLSNGKPSVEIKDGKTYTYSIDVEKLESMEYDSAEFHFHYYYDLSNGVLQKIFRDNNKTKETEGRYYLSNELVKYSSFGPKFSLIVRNNNEVIKGWNNPNNRLYIERKVFNDISSMYIVTSLPYQAYANNVLTGILYDKWVEQYAYKDAKLRLKTLKTENGLTKVTWYYQNGNVQCDYFVRNNNPESGLIGLGTEFREDGSKLKEIFISKDSTGYYKEFDLSGTISIEYGLDSGDWGKDDSKGCVNYREFYPFGKISLELGLFSSGFKNTEYYESGNKKSEIFKVEGLKIARRISYDEAGNATNMKEICNEIITSYSKAFENKFTTIISGGDPSGRLPVLKTPDDVYYSISHPIGEDIYSMFIKVLDVIKLQFANATASDDQKNMAVTFGKVVAKLISSSESETFNIYEQLNNLGKKDLKSVENIKRVIGI